MGANSVGELSDDIESGEKRDASTTAETTEETALKKKNSKRQRKATRQDWIQDLEAQKRDERNSQ